MKPTACPTDAPTLLPRLAAEADVLERVFFVGLVVALLVALDGEESEAPLGDASLFCFAPLRAPAFFSGLPAALSLSPPPLDAMLDLPPPDFLPAPAPALPALVALPPALGDEELCCCAFDDNGSAAFGEEPLLSPVFPAAAPEGLAAEVAGRNLLPGEPSLPAMAAGVLFGGARHGKHLAKHSICGICMSSDVCRRDNGRSQARRDDENLERAVTRPQNEKM